MLKCKKEFNEANENSTPTLSIVLVGYAGLGGSIELIKDNEEKLSKHFSKYFMSLCKKLDSFLVESEPFCGEKIAQEYISGEVLELGKLGIHNSLWSALWNICELNLAKKEQIGIDVDITQIPIRQETIEICQFFGLNPYKISSKGSYLILTKDPDKVITLLEREKVKASMIGVLTDKKERIIRRADYIRHLPRPSVG